MATKNFNLAKLARNINIEDDGSIAFTSEVSAGVGIIGSLDFSPSAINETSTITTSSDMSNAPFISAFKEVPQTGVSTKGNWDVNSTASNYDLLDEAPLLYSGATITPSSATGDGTFTLSSGSFSSSDIGKRVIGNSGEATIKATDGSYAIHTNFADTNAISAGDWKLEGLFADSSIGLKLNKSVDAYNIANASYDSVSFSVTSQEASPNGMCWNNDGTKLYITGQSGDDVNEYSLSTAYDITTASYTTVFDVGDQESGPQAIRFNNDGTKMYILGTTGDDVNQYSLTTAFDVSTASFDSVTFYVGSQDTSPAGLAFNADGTKMFMIGATSNKVYQYTLTTAFDISTASYNNVSFLADSGYHQYQDLEFNNDGTKLFIIDNASSGITIDSVIQVSLTTAFDLSTASDDDISFSVSSEEVNGKALLFNADGTKMYIAGSTNDTVFQYSTGDILVPTSQYFTATTNTGGQIDTESWNDLNSLTADETLNDGAAYYAFSTDDRITWKVQNSGGDLRSIARLNSSTWQYNSSNDATSNFQLPSSALAFATGTSSSYSSKYIVQPVSGATDADIVEATIIPVNGVSGKGLVVADRDTDIQRYFTLATAYDLSSTLTEVDISSINWNPASSANWYGGMFNPDGTKFFVASKDGYYQDIRQYNLTTAYDLSTATLQSDHFNSSHGFPMHYTYVMAGVSDDKIYLCRNANYNHLFSKNLTASGDIDTSHTTLTQEANLPNVTLNKVKISADGKRIFAHDNGTTNHYLYTLTTAWDFTSLDGSATITNTTADGVTSSQSGLQYDEEGKYIVGLNTGTNEVYLSPSSTFLAGNGFDHETWVNATSNDQQAALQQALGAQSANRLTGTNLATYSDANLLATGDTFDLMIGLYMGSAGTSPTSDAITISYDGATQNLGAILGTDYNVDKISDTRLKVTALTQKNMHFKVI